MGDYLLHVYMILLIIIGFPLILNISSKETILTLIQAVKHQNTTKFISLWMVWMLLVVWIKKMTPLSMSGHVLRLGSLNRAHGMIKPNLISCVQEGIIIINFYIIIPTIIIL